MQGKPTEKRKRELPTGILHRHSRYCPSLTGGVCTVGKRDGCQLAYRAWVFDRSAGVAGEKTFKTFATLAEAKKWRNSKADQLARGKRVAQSRQTLNEAAAAWLAGVQAEPPTVLNRSGLPYKPSAFREYERNLRNYLLPELGARRLSDIGRGTLQKLIEQWRGESLSGSKIKNIMLPLRVIFKREIDLENVTENPTVGLRFPNGARKPRDRAASATEAAKLIAPLPDDIRAIYAAACYAGLRRGELQALRWDNVDLPGGIITVSRSWDEVAGEIDPKSDKGTRTVPITRLLSDHLRALKASTGRDGSDFVFGREPRMPFTPSYVRKRAAVAWQRAPRIWTGEAVELLEPIGLHECRHTFVSLMHDAGFSLERIGPYVGHSSTYMTEAYRHLLDGHEAETGRLFGEYLARADTTNRLEQLDQ